VDRITLLIGLAGTALLVATLAGLIWRRRWASCYSFTLYISAMALATGTFLAVPSLYNEIMWTVHLNVVNMLRYAVAIELAMRTFRSFPGATSTLRLVLLFVLVVTLILVTRIPRADVDYRAFLQDQQPRLLNGVVWLYTSIAALILWYRLPIAPFHKSILLPYVPYLFFQLVYLHVFVERGWENPLLGYVNQMAYLVLVACWTRAAWRGEGPRPGEPPGSVQERSDTHAVSRVA
jgi:hypothetical protein